MGLSYAEQIDVTKGDVVLQEKIRPGVQIAAPCLSRTKSDSGG